MFKISSIKIHGEEIEVAAINIIVGTNNSGKSTFLNELNESLNNLQLPVAPKWIEGVKIEVEDAKADLDTCVPGIDYNLGYEDSQSNDSIRSKIAEAGIQNIYNNGNIESVGYEVLQREGNLRKVYEILPPGAPKDSEYYFFNFFSKFYSKAEFCSERLGGPFDAQVDEQNSAYTNIVHFLYSNDPIFRKIVEHIKRVFGIEIVFDDVRQANLPIRIKPSVPIPRRWTSNRQRAQFWNDNSPKLVTQGDGIKSYLRLIFALFTPYKNVILIDEPEAFLHPPQRRALGQFISRNSNATQVFIATHDSEFLRGLLVGSNDNIKVFYLNNHQAQTPDLASVERSSQYNESLLGSYFNKATILCEAEDDRLVYERVATKYFPDLASDISFIGCNGKTEAIKNYGILKKSLLQVGCIFDLDALYSTEITSSAVGLSATDKTLVIEVRRELQSLLTGNSDTESKQMKRDFRVAGLSYILDAALKAKVERVIESMKNYKIYIISNGALESWFPGIEKGASRKIQEMINFIEGKKRRKIGVFVSEVLTNIVQ